MGKLITDIDLSTKDLQGLGNADAIAALFTRLGYNTNERVKQTAEALRIAGELKDRVQKIERISSDENLLQVYLFELKTVTVANTKDLSRVFRDFAVPYVVLVLTTPDYDRVDFVIPQKDAPKDGKRKIGSSQTAQVRPRTLTIERRGADREALTVPLRVLRRFTYTEGDAFAQYDKLLAAYTIADWSEPEFNNRALFADHFLRSRLPEFPEWKDDPKPAYKVLLDLYLGARAKFAGQKEEKIRRELLEPALKALGFAAQAGKKAGSDEHKADYLLHGDTAKGEAFAFCLAYPWDRFLDGKDYGRDDESPEENPGQLVVSLLEHDVAPWAIVTNGRIWRLYSKKTHAKATNYYEMDLEEVLSHPDGGDPFRFFWHFFRAEAFRLKETTKDGESRRQCFLDRVLTGSEDYAKQLGEALKERVFEDIFPHLAEGFIAKIREEEGKGADLSREGLDEVYEGTLVLLYRLLFLLYAEARDLLPVKEVRGYYETSLTKLRKEVAEKAKNVRGEDQDEANLKKAYSESGFGLYGRLQELFAVIDKGDPERNVPLYNGGLFITDPGKNDDAAEARAARFLLAHKVPDRHLAFALDKLARDVDEKGGGLVPVDYKSLGVRQLGSIYEGLLEFKLHIAGEKLGVTKEKSREVYVPFKELSEKEQQRAERASKIVPKGHAYLENDKRERKATGSYYTPDYIVKYIVENTVGPVLKEKFDRLRDELRAAEKWHRDSVKFAEQKGESKEKYTVGDAVENKWRWLVDDLFDVKVLDPAMGSGHFLVEAVDFVTDKALDYLSPFKWNPVTAHLEYMRRAIRQEMQAKEIVIDEGRLTDVNLLKRQILKRCVYGVDLNPMAVELAKVSLWLHCFTLGAPLSFLDHHLRCGNSLIGVTEEEVKKAQSGQMNLLSGTHLAATKTAVGGMLRVSKLSDVTAGQVHESQEAYQSALKALEPEKRLFDVYTSQWFGNEPTKSGKGKKASGYNRVEEFLRGSHVAQWIADPTKVRLSKDEQDIVRKTTEAAREHRFFHWELEFPEVFFGPREGTETVIERRPDGGFDAVVGNPPYVRVQELRKTDPAIADFLALRYASAVKNFDLYLPFFELGLVLARHGATYIAPNKWFSTDYGEGLRKLVVTRQALSRVVDFGDYQVFDGVTTYTSIVTFARRPGDSFQFIDASSGDVHVTAETRPSASLLKDGSTWSFASGAEAELMERLLNAKHKPLSVYRDRAFQGLRTSDNSVYALQEQGAPRKGLLKVESKATGKTHLLEHGLLKPLLSGDEIRAFNLKHTGQWLLFPYKVNQTKPSLISKKTLQADYPATWAYLTICEQRLRERERGRMDHDGWWGYIYPKNLDQFGRPKIMLPDYHDRPAAALDLDGRYYSITAYCVTLKPGAPLSLPVLACLLNSRLLFWLLAQIGTALQRGFVRFMPQYLDRLPIAAPNIQQAVQLERLAAKAMKDGFEGVEDELNRLIYELYGLTNDDVAIVEGRDERSSYNSA